MGFPVEHQITEQPLYLEGRAHARDVQLELVAGDAEGRRRWPRHAERADQALAGAPVQRARTRPGPPPVSLGWGPWRRTTGP
jgi:hypothetical protein